MRPGKAAARPVVRRRLVPAAVVTLACALTACGGGADQGGTAAGTSGDGQARTEVTVFAAASLKGAFTKIAADTPQLSVRFSFDGSNALVDQLSGGARADVFASADTTNMDDAVGKGLIDGKPQIFAKNVLVLVVPRGNPGNITGLDGSLTGKRLVVCAQRVPCGNATKTLADGLGVTLHPVSEETAVTGVRSKVEAGEADAGLVYATDAKAAGDKVQTIPVPGADKVVNDYPIALVKDAPSAAGGRAFVDAVRSERGRAVLTTYGFRAP